jgi:Cu2+-exporting ATPase
MSGCHLCDLPTPAPPVTEPAVDGEYCCRGCLEVARALDDIDELAGKDTVEDHATNESEIPGDARTTYLTVDGMHCTTCEAFLSIRADDIEGVYSIEANYGMETARVFYDPEEVDEPELPELLSGHGYEFRAQDSERGSGERARQRDTVQRLVVGGFFSMLIMPWYFFYLYPSYLGYGTGILDADSTTAVTTYLPLVILGFLTSIVLFYTGRPILRGGWVSARTRTPNMDLLVSIAALAAYCYSTVALATGSTHLYYDVTVAVVMIVTFGRYYEGKIRSQATAKLSDITAARETEATKLTDDGRETVDIAALEPGDGLVVAPGERVPVDGTVSEGVADVDESVLTGESLPVTKEPGDKVVGGSIVTDEALIVTVGEDVESTVDRIATALWEIQSTTPGIQRLADALATVFVPFVLFVAMAVVGWQLVTGGSVGTALLAGLVVLVVSCPCAMGLATPLAISGGLRDGLERGMVVTNESVFEVAPAVETIVFDKTGTLTTGEMDVIEVVGDNRTLRLAAAVEQFSSHPAADAILDAATEQPAGNDTTTPVADGGVTAHSGESTAGETGEKATEHGSDALPDVAEFARHPGGGISGETEAGQVVVGTQGLVSAEVGPVPEELQREVARIESEGQLAVVVGWNGQARGVIAVGDRTREEWERAIEAFADREVAVLTGDDGAGAEQFRDHPAIDTVFAGVPPDGKVETVRRLSAQGTTVMVGDGTNDAPALAAADLGIAMGDGTAGAIDAADVVVTDSDLTAVEAVFELASGTRRRIRQNIGWAFLYNAVAVPLAVFGLINPLFAALAMAASSTIVVSNSRRSIF